MSKKVFLSYAYQDRGIAQRAATLLKEHGHLDTILIKSQDAEDVAFVPFLADVQFIEIGDGADE